MYCKCDIHMYTHMEYYSTLKKAILPFATTWMNPEDTMLSEISQRKTKTTMTSFTCEI